MHLPTHDFVHFHTPLTSKLKFSTAPITIEIQKLHIVPECLWDDIYYPFARYQLYCQCCTSMRESQHCSLASKNRYVAKNIKKGNFASLILLQNSTSFTPKRNELVILIVINQYVFDTDDSNYVAILQACPANFYS